MRSSHHFPLGLKVGLPRAIFLVAAMLFGPVTGLLWGQAKPAPSKVPAAKQKPAPGPAVRARNFEPLPVNADLRNQRNAIQGLLRNGVITENARPEFVEYYSDYALARWSDPAGLPELEKKPNFNLPDCRRELLNELYLARNGPAHDELAKLALDFLTQLANNPTRFPASRINAMLAIGELKQVESRSRELPKPWPDALPVLVQAFGDADQLDGVRVAALVGIYRHAVLDAIDAPQVRAQLRSELLKVAQTKEDPRRSTEGQVWLRARAMDVLGALKDAGPQNAVVKALLAIVADQEDHLLARRAAAHALGNLNVPTGQGLDSSPMAVALAQLAADACAAELAKMEEEAEKKPTRRGMGPGMPGYMSEEYMPYESEYEEGPGSFGPGMTPGYDDLMGAGYDRAMGPEMGGIYGRRPTEKEDDTLNNRRRLKSYLNAAFHGLTGVDWPDWSRWSRENTNSGVLAPGGAAKLVADQGQADTVQGLMTQVDDLSKLCDNDDELAREEWTAQLEDQLGQLTQALGAASAPPAGAAPAPAAPATATSAEGP